MALPTLLAEPLARELLAATLVANLATFDEDGSIHLVPVWYEWLGEALLMPTNDASRKIRNLVTRAGLELPPVAEFLGFDNVVVRFTPERASSRDETQTEAARALRASGEYADTTRAPR